MVLLTFQTDCYTIKVASKDPSFSYHKFKRVDNYEHYCKYTSSNTNGCLKLYHPDRGDLVEIPVDEWDSAWPVFFETQVYSISIEITNIKKNSEPHFVHPSKEIEDLFSVIETNNGYLLSGSVNFLSEPGRFSLQFTYENADGIKHYENLDFDVVSPKLDTKKDLNNIIQELRNEYGDLVFRYLTKTFQQFSIGNEANNDLIWLSIFKKIVDKYIFAVRYILHSPHNRYYRREVFCKPERIKNWSPHLSEKLVDDYYCNHDDVLHKFYQTEYIEDTTDTRENRFVKYSLKRISERLKKLLDEIKKYESEETGKSQTSKNERESLENNLTELDALKKNSFWKGVGLFDGFRQESLVLQQRSGYAQVYRYWIMLQNGLDLIDGIKSVGVGIQQIWKLYELWCFLKIKSIVCELLELNPRKPEDSVYIRDISKNTFKLFTDGDLTGTLELTNKKNGDRVEIGYQYSYTRSNAEMKSMTVEQKPDIVINIAKTNGFVMTYLFDAKYRVKGDEANGCVERGDYPEDDTLNQMHRYRDAIYFGNKQKYNFAKEVIGGYILFPGRLDEQSILDGKEAPYYIKSIENVNIGAFPLLPNENSGLLLKEHLRKIILEKSVYEQIKNSVPQRGLAYHPHFSGSNNGIAMVMMENFDSKKDKIENGKIAIPIKLTKNGMSLLENMNNISYVLFHVRNKTENKHLFKIKKEPHIFKSDDSELSNYYKLQQTAQIYICVELDLNEENSDNLDPSKNNIPFDETNRYDAQYVEMNQLYGDQTL